MRISSAVVLTVMLLVLVPVVAHGQTGAPPEGYLVTPGKSLGQYSLDWSLDMFLAKLGTPSSITPLPFFPFGTANSYLWEQYGLAVYTRPDHQNRVLMIVIFRMPGNPSVAAENLKYRTAEGIGIDSPRTTIEQVYGDHRSRGVDPILKAEWVYYSNGLVFAFSTKNKPDQAGAIGVWSQEVWNLP